jgi:hypothetical protein
MMVISTLFECEVELVNPGSIGWIMVISTFEEVLTSDSTKYIGSV